MCKCKYECFFYMVNLDQKEGGVRLLAGLPNTTCIIGGDFKDTTRAGGRTDIYWICDVVLKIIQHHDNHNDITILSWVHHGTIYLFRRCGCALDGEEHELDGGDLRLNFLQLRLQSVYRKSLKISKNYSNLF